MATSLAGARGDLRDLGFGSRVTDQPGTRFLNRDGTFNVERTGISRLQARSLYHTLLTVSWGRFYGTLILLYLIVNLLFALGYVACGPGALHGSVASTPGEQFQDAFFFSVQTLATIGYGRISPVGLPANVLVAGEAFLGLLGVALSTSLSFARFARPEAHVLFSRRAVVAPYRGGRAFMFRVVHARETQLITVEAQVMLSRLEGPPGARVRRFHPLPLERSSVTFFPLHWTVVHPMDEASPLRGATVEDLEAADAEFLILLTAFDETSSQTVHARSSYKPAEVVVGARFVDMFVPSRHGRPRADLGRLHDLEPVDLPSPDRAPANV
jgi:inward rectifier potassium channel